MAIGGQAHDLVLVSVVGKAEILGEGLVEKAKRVGEIDPLVDPELGRRIADLATDLGVTAIVVGLPVSLDGTEGSVRLTRIVSPIPSARRAPMPMALLIRAGSPDPASVTPR